MLEPLSERTSFVFCVRVREEFVCASGRAEFVGVRVRTSFASETRCERE